MQVKTFTYPSGLRLIVDHRPDSKASTLFVGINTGSVNETDKNNGISHVIEHMLFKGTKTRSAKQISSELENLGAHVNAYTSKYHTCLYASCMSEYIGNSFDVLSDMFFNSQYDQTELDRELKVIFEEIDMYQDDPGSVAYEAFSEEFFKGTKLQNGVIGTKKILSKLKRQDILDYIKKYYVAPNVVVSVAGGVDYKTAKQLCDKYFASQFTGEAEPNVCTLDKNLTHTPKRSFKVIKKDISQTHIVIGYPTCSIYAGKHAPINVLSFVLGGGMSSRLFQTIREQCGYVYSINALPELYDIGGAITIALATNHVNQNNAIDKIKALISEFVKDGITQEELDRAKTFCKSMIVMSSETSVNIARHNVSNMLIHNSYKSIEKRLAEIEKVKLGEVNALIKTIFDTNNICAALVSDKPNKNLFVNI